MIYPMLSDVPITRSNYSNAETPQRLLLLMKIDGTHNEPPQCLKPMHKTVYLFKEVKLNH